MSDGTHCVICAEEIPFRTTLIGNFRSPMLCPHCGAGLKYDFPEWQRGLCVAAPVGLPGLLFGLLLAQRILGECSPWAMAMAFLIHLPMWLPVFVLLSFYLRARRTLQLAHPRKKGLLARGNLNAIAFFLFCISVPSAYWYMAFFDWGRWQSARTPRPEQQPWKLIVSEPLPLRDLVTSRLPEVSGGKVLFTFDGRPYTCQELTLVQYADGIALAEAMNPTFDDALGTGGFFSPGAGAWQPKGEKDLADYYHHQLNGAIELFVLYQISLEFRRQYPSANVAAQYDPDSVDRHLNAYADTRAEYRATLKKALAEAKDAQDFASRLARFVGPLSAERAEGYYSRARRTSLRTPMLWQFNSTCFPMKRDGTIAPWLRAQTLATLAQRHLTDEITRNLPAYVSARQAELSNNITLVLLNVTPTEKAALKKVLDGYRDLNGDESFRTRERLIERLSRRLGRPVRSINGSGGMIAHRLGLTARDLQPQQFVPITDPEALHTFSLGDPSARMIELRRATPDGAVGNYVYTLYATPKKVAFTPDPQPGGALFDTAHDILIPPIYRDVMSRLEVADGFAAPEERMIVSLGRQSPPPPRLFNTDLPPLLPAER